MLVPPTELTAPIPVTCKAAGLSESGFVPWFRMAIHPGEQQVQLLKLLEIVKFRG